MITGQIKRGGSLTGRVKQSGSLGPEIFWATRNVTTFAEVQEAVADGKLCAVNTGGTLASDIYYLFYINDTRATFGNFSIINSRIATLSLYSSNIWSYDSLAIPEALTFDTTPKQFSNNPVRSYGIWNAIQAAKTTVDATLSATSENPVQNRSVYEALATKADVSSVEPFVQDAVDEWMETYAPTIGTLSNAAKHALLNCFAHVAWIDDQGQSYYNALESELFPDATLDSITAVFTQGSASIYDTDSLDALRQYLVVTATYSDSTTATVTDYTLSGTLTAGTSTITVSYEGKTATFDVRVTAILYPLTNGSHTFTDSSYGYNGRTVTVSGGNHVEYTHPNPTTGDSSKKGSYAIFDVVTVNGTKPDTTNINTPSVTLFSLPSASHVVLEISNIQAVAIAGAANEDKKFAMALRSGSTSKVSTGDLAPTDTSKIVDTTIATATNITVGFFYAGTAISSLKFDVKLTVNGERWI